MEKDLQDVNIVGEEESVEEHHQEDSQDVDEHESESDHEEDHQEPDKLADYEERLERYQKKLKNVHKEKHLARQEAQVLREELERIRQEQTLSSEAAQLHYDNSIQLELNHAKQMKKMAIENGDADALIEADEMISRLAARKENMDQWKAREAAQKYYNQHYQPKNNQNYEVAELNETAEKWLNDNPWYDENRPEYDPDRAIEVQAFVAALDNKLTMTGRTDEFMTPKYFERIDNFVRSSSGNLPSYNSRNIPMRQSNQPVAPVKRNQGAVNSSRQQVRLTDEEKNLARMMKITPEVYARYKKLEQEKQRQKGMN